MCISELAVEKLNKTWLKKKQEQEEDDDLDMMEIDETPSEKPAQKKKAPKKKKSKGGKRVKDPMLPKVRLCRHIKSSTTIISDFLIDS